MTTRIGLLGYYGTRNLGDEAVLEGLLRAIESARPGSRVIVYASDPASVVPHPAVEVRRLRVYNLAAMVRAVGEMGALVIGGGGVLHDHSLAAPSRYLLWATAARLRRRPVMLAAVGVGAIHTRVGAMQIRAVASLADTVSVRDESSLRWLRLIGVNKKVDVLADPALLICMPHEHVEYPPGPAVFALRRWPPARRDDEDLARLLARAADAVVHRLGADLTFMPFHTPMDESFCATVRGMMEHPQRARVVARPASPKAAIEELARARVLVSMRLHGLMLAAGTGVSLVAVACDEKLASFMAAIGQEEFCLPLETLQPDAVAAACEGAVAERADSAAKVAASIRDLQARAGKITAVLRDFLARVESR